MAKRDKQKARRDLSIVEKSLGKKLKKPVCAYSIFMQDHQQETQERNPKLKHSEVMKKVSNMWKKLSDKRRKRYTDRAQ